MLICSYAQRYSVVTLLNPTQNLFLFGTAIHFTSLALILCTPCDILTPLTVGATSEWGKRRPNYSTTPTTPNTPTTPLLLHSIQNVVQCERGALYGLCVNPLFLPAPYVVVYLHITDLSEQKLVELQVLYCIKGLSSAWCRVAPCIVIRKHSR